MLTCSTPPVLAAAKFDEFNAACCCMTRRLDASIVGAAVEPLLAPPPGVKGTANTFGLKNSKALGPLMGFGDGLFEGPLIELLHFRTCPAEVQAPADMMADIVMPWCSSETSLKRLASSADESRFRTPAIWRWFANSRSTSAASRQTASPSAAVRPKRKSKAPSISSAGAGDYVGIHDTNIRTDGIINIHKIRTAAHARAPAMRAAAMAPAFDFDRLFIA